MEACSSCHVGVVLWLLLEAAQGRHETTIKISQGWHQSEGARTSGAARRPDLAVHELEDGLAFLFITSSLNASVRSNSLAASKARLLVSRARAISA